MTFKVVKRDSEECEHDSGIVHSIGMPCEVAESLLDVHHMRESDPLHEKTWHGVQKLKKEDWVRDDGRNMTQDDVDFQ